jgi:hypothetical protein
VELADLSYDPRDPTFPFTSVLSGMTSGTTGPRWSVQVFTTENVYGVDPDHVRTSSGAGGYRMVAEGLSWAGQQQRSAGRVEVQVSPEPASPAGPAWWVAISAEHAEPIKAVKLVLRHLPAEVVRQGWWSMIGFEGMAEVPTRFRPMLWRYPYLEWVTPWAAAGEPDVGAGHVTVSCTDPVLRPKRLFGGLPGWAGGEQVVEIVLEESATQWGGRFTAPDVRVGFPPDGTAVRADALAHLDRMASAHALVAWEDRADVPAWFRDVGLVVNLHGRHWTGYVFNTYEQMAEALRAVTDRVDGAPVLAYLPGWEGRYYHAYPWYRPDPDLGGDAGFSALVDEAHRLGVHVMPMFGMHGVNATSFPEWEASVGQHPTFATAAYVNHPDWDGDRAGEDFQVFCNPGEPGFRAHLLEQVSAVVEGFGVDGVFLDTSGCWWNDRRFDVTDGYRSLVGSLRAAHPDLLVAGEGWCDALLGVFPVNQSWFGVDAPYRVPEVLSRYARAVGHLSMGAPGSGSTGVHEAGYLVEPSGRAAHGHLPTISVVDDTLTTHRAAFDALLDRIVRGADG